MSLSLFHSPSLSRVLPPSLSLSRCLACSRAATRWSKPPRRAVPMSRRSPTSAALSTPSFTCSPATLTFARPASASWGSSSRPPTLRAAPCPAPGPAAVGLPRRLRRTRARHCASCQPSWAGHSGECRGTRWRRAVAARRKDVSARSLTPWPVWISRSSARR